MMGALTFWLGVLFCGLVVFGGELLNQRIEARLHARAARRRVSRLA